MKVSLFMVLIAAAAITLCAPSCGGGGGGSSAVVTTPQYGAIEGYVYAPVGSGARAAAATPTGFKAVADVTVNATCGSTDRNSSTNSTGYFSIQSLPAGVCTIKINKSGFSAYQSAISISANKTLTIGGTAGITLLPSTYGTIKVTSNVEGAEVIIDGENTSVEMPQSLTVTLSNIAVGDHTVTLEKQDFEVVGSQSVNVLEGETAEVVITLNPQGNIAPVANAGSEGKAFVAYRYEWNEASSSYDQKSIDYTLDGSGSADVNSDVLTYEWTQVSGPAITLSNANAAQTVFTPASAGTYRFRLAVSDGYLEDSSEVTVTAYEVSGKLAFYAYPLTSEIFLMNADGTEYRQLTDHSTSDSRPKWSPDGTRIAYSADNGTATFMALINSDGTGQTTTAILYGALDWFSDGTILAWKYYTGQLDFYRVNTNGTGEVRLTTIGINGSSAQVSPDGTKIAFPQNWGGENYEIMVMNQDGSNIQRLTNNSTTDLGVTWLSDNEFVYTTQNFVGDKVNGLFKMKFDGSNATEIPMPSDLTDIKSNITTSADGQFIFLQDQNGRLGVMFSDGSAYISYGIVGYNPDYHPGP